MAKTISDEQIKLSIILNGDPAQKQLLDLEKSTRNLTKETTELKIQRTLLEQQGKKDTQQWRDLNNAIKANTTTIDNNRATMRELQNQIGITGLTMAQLTQKANMLRSTLRNLVPGSADYQRYQAELTQVNNRLGELNGRAQTARLSIGGIADGFNRYAALGATAVAGLTGVVLSVQKIIDLNGKLSDSQSDVRKTTGMTTAEVDELTKSFGLMKTRTSRIDLLGIAEIGGRLGIAKDEIGAFVEVMNKANVALGDSFEGGPEVVAEKLGKIKGLYSEIKNARVEDAFNAVGSAINDLGASGTASEDNLAEFATRVGAMPEVLKPTLAQALGLGAAFEESGLKAEIAGTNYGKVISIAARDFPKFAQVMGMAEGKVKDLINTNPTEFFLQFSKSLKGMDATQLAQTLDYLKLNDNEVKMVLGAASQNVDLFREKIDLAAQSMAEATSLTNEYALKNNNLQATLEKIQKTVSGWFSSETFVLWLSTSFGWLSKFIGATEDADGAVEGFRNKLILFLKVLTIIIVSYISYNTAIKLTVLWTRTLAAATQILSAVQNRGAIATGILKSAQLLLSSAYYAVTGNTTRATAAMRLFNATVKTNPIGLLVTLLMAAGAAFILFGDNAKKAATAQSTLYDIQQKTGIEIQDQKTKIAQLLKIAQDRALADQVRLDAIKQLNAISPEYLGNITLENVATKATTEAVYAYIKALDKKLEAEALDQSIKDAYQRKTEISKTELTEYGKWYDKFWLKLLGVPTEATGEVLDQIKRRDEALKSEQELIKGLLKRREALMRQGGSPVVVAPGTGGSIGETDEQKAAREKAAKEAKRRADELKKNQADLLQLEREHEDARIAAMDSAYARERQTLETQYTRKIEDLKNRMVLESDLELALKNSKNKKLSKSERDFWKQKYDFDIEKNQHLNGLIEQEATIHEYKKGTMYEKTSKDHLQKQKEAYDLAKIQRETEYTNQLAALGTNEAAKEALTKRFNEQESKIEEEHVRQLIKEIEKIIGKDSFGNFDLSLLSPEQVAYFEKEAKRLGLTLAQIIEMRNKLGGNSKSDMSALGLGGNVDILGFTQDNWATLFKNLQDGKNGVADMLFVVSGLNNLWGKYGELVNAQENAQLKQFEENSTAKKQALQDQLDSGYITKVQFDRRTKVIDKENEKRKAEIEYNQAKRTRTMALANVAIKTAEAVMSVNSTGGGTYFADFGVSAAILTALVLGAGAMQAATILATPLPAKGYEDGLYPTNIKRQQDGKMFKANYGGQTQSGVVNKPTYFLTGENGPEMIIDSNAYKKMNPRLREALLSEIRGIKGYENGYYQNGVLSVNSQTTTTPGAQSNTSDSALMQMLIKAYTENTAVLTEIKNTGLLAVVSNRDLPSMKKLDEGIQAAKDLRNKNKL
jgi:tubulin-specific chaperone A